MAEPYARGIWARFAPTEAPFDAPTDMEDNLRTIDDHLAIYTLQPPIAVGSSLPSSPANGDGQLISDGTYAVFNGGAWKNYPPLKGLPVMLASRADIFIGTGTGWASLKDALGITALLAGQGSNIVGKATLADLNSDLAYPAGAVGWVLNDPTAANNVIYRKTGSNGTGSWVAASNSLLSQIQISLASTQALAVSSSQRLDAATPVLASLDVSYERAPYSWAVVDQLGRIAIAAAPDGKIVFGRGGDIDSRIATAASALSALTSTFASVISTTGFGRNSVPWAVIDDAGAVALSLTDAGQFVIGRFNFSKYLAQAPADRSGYVWAVTDESDRVALGLTNEGRLIVRGVDLGGLLNTQYPSRAGKPWAIVDSNDKVALWLDDAGNLWSKNKNLTAGSDSATVANLSRWVTPADFYTSGDSLTAGAGGTPYPSVLATLLGKSVINGGIGGQTSTQIMARQGGFVPLITLSGNTIPASGSVSVTSLEIAGVLNTASFGRISPFNNQGPSTLSGTLAGVPGYLTATGFDGGGYPTGHSFTRSASGTALVIDAKTPFIVDTSDKRDFCTTIFWPGRNDAGSSTLQADVLAALTAGIGFLKPLDKRFVVMSVLNTNAEVSGGGTYNAIVALNNEMKARWPRNYIDIRSFLVRNYNPSIAQDVTDFGNDVVPSSLRSDSIHLNTAGYALVASRVYQFLTEKGWLT